MGGIFMSQRIVKGQESADDAVSVQKAKNEAAISLLQEWLADESGYDEKTWPIIKKAIEENRLSDRRPFSL